MISFCTAALNTKNETRTFVEALAFHNKNCNFEICIAHDDRVDDGSKEFYQKLQEEYPFVKIVRNTEDQTISYLQSLLTYYDAKSIFPKDLREKLQQNLHTYSYKKSLLFDPTKSYLWLGMGHLFNKAANIASGDVLIFAPTDYIWTCNLNDLELYVINNREDGIFYGKFDGLYDPISNEDYDVLRQAIRSDKPAGRVSRRYLDYPSTLKDHYLIDFQDRALYSVGDPSYPSIMKNLCSKLKREGSSRYAKMHHGTHIITKKAFDIIGGFSEEFYGRAWQDDKMNSHAMRLFWRESSSIPSDFAFNWISMAGWCSGLSGIHPHSYDKKDLEAKDPWIFKRPIQGKDYKQVYLHDDYHDETYIRNINAELDKEFKVGNLRGREAPIVRIIT